MRFRRTLRTQTGKRWLVAALGASVVLAGCVPSDPTLQAEGIESIAAEGGLLAHDLGNGSTTSVFAREHAKALRGKLDEIEAVVDDPALARLATEVAGELQRLIEASPEEAPILERRLERLAVVAKQAQ